MILLPNNYAITANRYNFILQRKLVSDKGIARWEIENGHGGYYPTLSTLMRGLSDRHIYESAAAVQALSDVQEDLVQWAESLKSPLVRDLREALRRGSDDE